MNKRTTRWLVIAAFALLGYILLFERGDALRRRSEQESLLILPGFDPRRITGVEIAFRTNPVVRAERTTNGAWQLALPVAYPAQGDQVEALLAAFASVSRRAEISKAEVATSKGGLADYGLNPPSARVVFQNGSVRTEIRIGARSPLGDSLYIQRQGSDSLDVVGASLLTSLPATSQEWRDPSLVWFDRSAVDRIEVRSEGAFYELQLDTTNRQWRLTKPLTARANSLRVETLLRLLEEARVSGYVADAPGTLMESLGLATPQLELSLGRGTNLLTQVLFGLNPSNRQDLVHARLASRTNVVLVPRELADHFRPPHTRFRDTHLATFPASAAEIIEVAGRESFQLRKQTNGVWRVAEPFNYDADPALVQRLMEVLGGLEVSDFVQEVVTDFALFGLGPTNRQLTIRSGPTNSPLAQIQLGNAYQGNRIYARRTDEPSLYAVRQADALQLPVEAFELRDRHPWKFPVEQVVSVSVSLKGQARKITRGPGGGWVVSPAYAAVTGALLEEALYQLGQLQVLTWVARGEDKLRAFGFPDEAHQLSIEVRAGDKLSIHTLNFGQLSPWNSPYASTTLGGETVIFGIPPKVYDLYELVLKELRLAQRTP